MSLVLGIQVVAGLVPGQLPLKREREVHSGTTETFCGQVYGGSVSSS